MKKRLAAIILALLCGCSSQSPIPVELENKAELPPVVETPAKPVPEPATPPPAPVDTMTVDGNAATITLGSKRSFDAFCLEGLSEQGELTIRIDNKEIYKQENNSVDRWCWLGAQSADCITITLPEGCTVEQFRLPEPVKSATNHLSAYLPHSSYSEQILHSEALESLDELTINTGCYWLADGSLEVKQNLPDIIASIQSEYPELNIYCTINPKKGGAAAIMTEEARQVLVQSMIDFCEEHHLAGVDIDWEFPAEDQWDEFSHLIVKLSEALTNDSRSLSLAFYPEDVNLSPEAIKAVHKVNVMAYDQFDEQGRHSTYETAVESIDYFLSLGFKAEQLSLGLPAYGRPLSGEAVWPIYSEYADLLSDGTNLLNENYFNSPQLVQDKTLLARETGLQGVFLYHLGCDSLDEASLILACSEVLA